MTPKLSKNQISMFSSILIFDFYLILGSFFSFWGPNGLFFGLKKGSNTVFEKLSFSMFSSILIFDFYLILGSFFSFWGPNRLFLVLEYVSTTVLGYTYKAEKLLFLCVFFNYSFCFWPQGPLFYGVRVRLKNCFEVESSSWKHFIFYVSFNSDFWSRHNFWVIFDILGHSWPIFGIGVWFKSYFGVY